MPGLKTLAPRSASATILGGRIIKRFLYQQSGSLGLRRASAGKGDGRTGELTGVDSTARDQLVVRPRLDDQAILEDMDHVAVDNGRQAVRNNDRGPPLQEFAQAVLDQALVERVEGRGLIPSSHEMPRVSARARCLAEGVFPCLFAERTSPDSLASSSTRMGGSLRIVRAIETRCFSPPLSL